MEPYIYKKYRQFLLLNLSDFFKLMNSYSSNLFTRLEFFLSVHMCFFSSCLYSEFSTNNIQGAFLVYENKLAHDC